MARRTALFFLTLAALVGALGVFPFAGPANVGKDLFLIFLTYFLTLAAPSFVLPAGRGIKRAQ